MRPFVLIVLLLAPLPCGSDAQLQPPGFGETMEVRIISVDVGALDENGAPGDFKKARASSFTYKLEIDVRDTTDRVMIAVVDEIDGDAGYATLPLDLARSSKAERKDNVIPPGPIDPRSIGP